MGAASWTTSSGMSMFLAQCPHCETIFQTDASLLSAHSGKVICGECRGTFNAIEHPYRFHVEQPSVAVETDGSVMLSSDPESVLDKVEAVSAIVVGDDSADSHLSAAVQNLFEIPEPDLLHSDPQLAAVISEATDTLTVLDSLAEQAASVQTSLDSNEIKSQEMVVKGVSIAEDFSEPVIDIPVLPVEIGALSHSAATISPNKTEVPMVSDDLMASEPVLVSETADTDNIPMALPMVDDYQERDIEDLLSLIRKRESSIELKEKHPVLVDRMETLSLSAENHIRQQDSVMSFPPLQEGNIQEKDVQKSATVSLAAQPVTNHKGLMFLCVFLIMLLVAQILFFFWDMFF